MPLSQCFQLLPGVLAALSCWWMASVLCRAWLTPLAIENGRWVSLGVGIVVMEFILATLGLVELVGAWHAEAAARTADKSSNPSGAGQKKNC